MNVAAVIKLMRAKGMSDTDILDVVEAGLEGERVRSAAAERQARYRERHRDVTGDVTRDVTGPKEKAPHTPQKETSLDIPPSPPTGAQTPKGSRQAGGRLPDDWGPKPEAFDYAAERGMDGDETRQCAAEMREWAHANANRPVARKANWDLTFLGFIRRYAERKARAGSRAPPGRLGNRWDDVKQQLGET